MQQAQQKILVAQHGEDGASMNGIAAISSCAGSATCGEIAGSTTTVKPIAA